MYRDRKGVMKAVILAAGEEIRMRPLTCTRPKVMLPLANRPILEHLLVETRKAGITEFIENSTKYPPAYWREESGSTKAR